MEFESFNLKSWKITNSFLIFFFATTIFFFPKRGDCDGLQNRYLKQESILQSYLDTKKELIESDSYQKMMQATLFLFDELGVCYEKLNDKNKALQTYFTGMAFNPNFIEIRSIQKKVIHVSDERKKLFEKRTIWTGQSLKGKTIYVFAEKGLGDTLHFCRFLSLLEKQGAKVMFKVQSPLKDLIASSGFNLILVDTNVDVFSLEFDYYIPLLSIPFVLGLNYDSIDQKTCYLSVSQEKMQQKAKLFQTNKYKIGLFWQGDKNHPNDKNRSLPLLRFYEIAKLSQVQCYSLQKGYGTEQLKMLTEGVNIIDLEPELNNFTDTAAIINNLDLVITVDTAVAHLSGGLGKKTFLLLPELIDWRWMVYSEEGTTVWYPTVKKFQQTQTNDWDKVMAEVLFQVKQLILKSKI